MKMNNKNQPREYGALSRSFLKLSGLCMSKKKMKFEMAESYSRAYYTEIVHCFFREQCSGDFASRRQVVS